jgi:hypothetical protein
MHWSLTLPVILWLGLLVATIAVPWLAPDPDPLEPLRHYRRLTARYKRQFVKQSMSARIPGASRLGYHRKFPLRCHRKNLYATQPPPRHRWDAPPITTLVAIAHAFQQSLRPLPTP